MRVENLVVVQSLAEEDNRPVVDIQVEMDSPYNLVEEGRAAKDNLVVEGRAAKDNRLDCILFVAEYHRSIGC